MRSAAILAFAASACAASAPAMTRAPPEATLPCGAKLKGVASSTLHTFRGVPYGTAERWMPPIAAHCPGGGGGSVFNATVAGGICWQMDGHVYVSVSDV